MGTGASLVYSERPMASHKDPRIYQPANTIAGAGTEIADHD
jgi:hypothetical protein